MKRTAAAFAATAAVLRYFFDAQKGERRRDMLRDRAVALFRRSGGRAEQLGREVAADAQGLVEQATTELRHEPAEQADDVTLAQKVQSEIFRDSDVPKGQINVNAEEGKVVLRGEVERPELIEELVERTRNVQGVREVENLLRVASES